MRHLEQGKYLGENAREYSLEGILLSETRYPGELSSEWHTHENPYFAFILNGGCIEKRKTQTVECSSGKLFFYNLDEQHRNTNYKENSRIFNIEISRQWLKKNEITGINGSNGAVIANPSRKFLTTKILNAFKYRDLLSDMEIESLIIELLTSADDPEAKRGPDPDWVKLLKAILQERWQDHISLSELSGITGVHPVTICKYFRKYFGCSLGEYVRRVKIDRALFLLKNQDASLASIAYTCGFADQSHFTRVFKQQTGMLPHHYRSV